MLHLLFVLFFFFFFNDTATTEIYTLSLHDALPICAVVVRPGVVQNLVQPHAREIRKLHLHDRAHPFERDRKSTRLNSSHANISYAVFCLKKKKKKKIKPTSLNYDLNLIYLK